MRREHGERGLAIVEMALALPVLLLLVLGALDLGRAVYVHSALANAARDGARFASVDPTNEECIRRIAVRLGATASLRPEDVTIAYSGALELDQSVTVSVASSYRPLTGVIAEAIGEQSRAMSASSTMQITNLPASRLSCPSPSTATPTAGP